MHRYLVLFLPVLLVLSACQKRESESPTSGHLYLLATESAAPALIEEVNQFLDAYRAQGAHITYSVVPSEDAIQHFVNDTVRCIFSVRPLTAEEREHVKSSSRYDLTEVLVAYDATLAVVNEKNPVNQITVEEIRDILTGKITRWEQLAHRAGMRGRIEVVYEDSSDVSWYLARRVLQGQQVGKNISFTRSSVQTLTTIADRRSSIGFVGKTWIDSVKAAVNVLKVGETVEPADTSYRVPQEALGQFFSAHPAYIYQRYYPLRGVIYFYARAPLESLASGFGFFVAGNEGQRLFLTRGLVPGTREIRLRVPGVPEQ
jgi:phosphate transport system substrate-binding protein